MVSVETIIVITVTSLGFLALSWMLLCAKKSFEVHSVPAFLMNVLHTALYTIAVVTGLLLHVVYLDECRSIFTFGFLMPLVASAVLFFDRVWVYRRCAQEMFNLGSSLEDNKENAVLSRFYTGFLYSRRLILERIGLGACHCSMFILYAVLSQLSFSVLDEDNSIDRPCIISYNSWLGRFVFACYVSGVMFLYTSTKAPYCVYFTRIIRAIHPKYTGVFYVMGITSVVDVVVSAVVNVNSTTNTLSSSVITTAMSHCVLVILWVVVAGELLCYPVISIYTITGPYAVIDHIQSLPYQDHDGHVESDSGSKSRRMFSIVDSEDSDNARGSGNDNTDIPSLHSAQKDKESNRSLTLDQLAGVVATGEKDEDDEEETSALRDLDNSDNHGLFPLIASAIVEQDKYDYYVQHLLCNGDVTEGIARTDVIRAYCIEHGNERDIDLSNKTVRLEHELEESTADTMLLGECSDNAQEQTLCALKRVLDTLDENNGSTIDLAGAINEFRKRIEIACLAVDKEDTTKMLNKIQSDLVHWCKSIREEIYTMIFKQSPCGEAHFYSTTE